MSNSENETPKADTVGAVPPADDEGNLASAATKSLSKTAWTGAAVGIGSAAIVAALLYTRKRG